MSNLPASLLELTKPKLTLLVVFSSAMGYLMGADHFDVEQFILLSISGYFITASANIFNQIIEVDLDKKMKRTAQRPLPTGRVTKTEAITLGATLLLVGLIVLYVKLNAISAFLSFISWFLYVLVYTPLKQITPLCVLVGAFPGAFPPMLGWLAATGEFGVVPGLLFLAQFAWQFPHFWAIAWKQYDQYHAAGFKMLPLAGGKTHKNAQIIFTYTLFTLPCSMLLYHFEISGKLYYAVAVLSSLVFSLCAYQFFRDPTDKAALRLMFYSFLYLPLIQIFMVIDKL